MIIGATQIAATFEAAENLRRVADAHTWSDLGPHLTCPEANALVALLEALGLTDEARWLEDGHAEGDTDPSDLHYRGGS